MMRLAVLTALILTSATSTAVAWGKRGHTIVCETAALLASASQPKAVFLSAHSFDLGYYCNVPDLVWKKPETYQLERNNHFMDLEIFARALNEKSTEAFKLDRLAFEKAYPDVKEEAGRAYWRVRELEARLSDLSSGLRKGIEDQSKRHKTQLDWLTTAGAIGHYIGDLSQPLHVTENYDGQLTDQKGIHSFYEEAVVDHLSTVPTPNALAAEVGEEAGQAWPQYRKKVEKLSTLELMQDLASTSNKELAALLAIDKKTGRTDLSKAAKAYRRGIVARLSTGSLALAEIYRRNADRVEFDEKKFYSFDGAPAFLAPPAGKD